MVRRSFRVGLRLGLLIGIGFALFKTFQARRPGDRSPASGPGPWEPLRSDAGSPAAGRPEPAVVRTPPPAPAPPPRPAPETLRMPEVPDLVVPPSAASEGHAATSTPPRPPADLPVDEVGEPIEVPAAPPAPVVTPPETTLLDAGVRPAQPEPEPEVEVDPRDVPAPAIAPVKKTAARKRTAAPKPATSEPVAKKAPAKKATKAPAAPPASEDDITPDDAAVKKAAKKATKAAKAAKKAAASTPPPAWVEAADGTCPPTHPVKAKLASKLFHLPGMFAYPRTKPDRCYLDADTAVADGFTAAKR
jgi:hypothetical protein